MRPLSTRKQRYSCRSYGDIEIPIGYAADEPKERLRVGDDTSGIHPADAYR